MDLIQLEQKELREFKRTLHETQNNVCPLLDVERPLDDMVVDHKHKLKANPAGPNGDGLVRGAIDRFANALEGKITNNWKRMGLGKYTDLPTYLRNLADYLENPPCEQRYIHPSEKIKVKKLGKRNFNKIAKLYKADYPKRKELTYPKSKKATKLIKQLAEQYGIEL